MGNRTTMHQKMSQMAGVMSLFAVVIFLVLIVSCVCMVRLAHRSKTKPRPPSPGAKENSPHAGAAFCPSSLGMIYTRSHMPLPESTVGGICTFSTMQPLKYGYGEPESWNMQGQEPCEGDCAFLEAQERLLPTPSAKEFYRPMHPVEFLQPGALLPRDTTDKVTQSIGPRMKAVFGGSQSSCKRAHPASRPGLYQ
ncbi:unnamed protein product [Dibothriocephalus latus]|uniref:Uncharacterized protein n=1 Tax=Dibothriocephalus latus TaxID=60516 RepID=A0A3P7MWE9_DIBLA|nr:unnamed protein product [Dibothriocephalus latus]